jgi:hypothetical protein
VRVFTRGTATGEWTERTVRSDGVRVTDAVNERSTASVALIDQTGVERYQRGQGVRVDAETGALYLRLPRLNGNYAWAPHDAAYNITAAVSLDIDVSPDDWRAPGDSQVLFDKAIAYRLYVASDGRLRFQRAASSPSFPTYGLGQYPAGGERRRVLIQYDSATDTAWHYERIGGAWSFVASFTGGLGSEPLTTNGEGLQVGVRFDSGGTQPLGGRVYRARLYDGLLVGGAPMLVADMHPGDGAGALAWTSASTGEAWTVTGEEAGIEPEHATVFQGFVHRATEARLGVDGTREHHLECVDLHYLADKRVITAAYQDQTAGAIVRDIISTHLAGEGVTEGIIHDGPTIRAVTWAYAPIADALRDLAERAGYWWRIGHDAALDFAAPLDLITVWAGDDATLAGDDSLLAGEHGAAGGALLDVPAVALADTIRVARGSDGYRNRQWVRGGRDRSVPQVEVQHGDGEKRAFALGFPVAEEPTVEVSRAGGAYQAETAGAAGIQSDRQWLYSFASPTLHQNTTGTRLAPEDRVRVTYVGLFDVISRVDDPPAQVDRAAVEGGTGVVEQVLIDSTSRQREAAFQLAGEMLAYWTRSAVTVRFATLDTTLTVGTAARVQLPEAGLDGESALIVSVERFTRQQVPHAIVTLAAGPLEGSWAQWLGALSRRIDRAAEPRGDEVEVVTTFEPFEKFWAEAETPNIFRETRAKTSGGAVAGADTYPEFEAQHRVTHLEWWHAGSPLGRKAFTTQQGADTDSIITTTVLVTTDAVGEIAELAWYGGWQAAAGIGTGVEIDRAAFVKTKTDIEQIVIEKTDWRWS